MTKSRTGTWRVDYKLIRTGTLGTKKEKLQANVGWEDGGSIITNMEQQMLKTATPTWHWISY